MIDKDNNNNDMSCCLSETHFLIPRLEADTLPHPLQQQHHQQQQVASPTASSSFPIDNTVPEEDNRSQGSSDDREGDLMFESDIFVNDNEVLLHLLVDLYLMFENSSWILKGFLW